MTIITPMACDLCSNLSVGSAKSSKYMTPRIAIHFAIRPCSGLKL